MSDKNIIVDASHDLRALGPSGIYSSQPESDDEVVLLTVTGPDGKPIQVPIHCSSPAARPPKDRT